MNLACFASPVTAALAVTGIAPLVVSPSRPAAPPAPSRPPFPPSPAPCCTFTVTSPQGGQTVIAIPRCYLVPGLKSLAGRMQAASREQHSPLLAAPAAPPPPPLFKPAPLPVIPPFVFRSLPPPSAFPPPAPAYNGDTHYKGAVIVLRSMPQIPPCRLAFDFRPAPARFDAAGKAKRHLDFLKPRQNSLHPLFLPRQALPNAATPPAPR